MTTPTDVAAIRRWLACCPTGELVWLRLLAGCVSRRVARLIREEVRLREGGAMRTVTFTNETWKGIERWAAALEETPDELVERLVAAFLASCDGSVTQDFRELAFSRVHDEHLLLLEATEEAGE